MKASTQRWLEFAKADLMNCELIINHDLLTGIVAFHAQQAVEKSFKAVLEENEVAIPRIHSLQRLFDMTEPYINLEIQQDDLAILDSIYTSTRYPVGLGSLPSGKPTIDEAKNLYSIAEKIFHQVNKALI
jgi:HEPN domain-containing protein